jgi:hypothetical protein
MTKCNGNNCKTLAKYSIVYDGGESAEQTLTLCQNHYDSNPVFRKFILKIEEIEE